MRGHASKEQCYAAKLVVDAWQAMDRASRLDDGTPTEITDAPRSVEDYNAELHRVCDEVAARKGAAE